MGGGGCQNKKKKIFIKKKKGKKKKMAIKHKSEASERFLHPQISQFQSKHDR